MKKYPKTFEDVFSSDTSGRALKIDVMQVSNDHMGSEEYTELFKTFLQDFYLDLFNNCVKLSWLRRNFKYKNKKYKYPFKNIFLNIIFVYNLFNGF